MLVSHGIFFLLLIVWSVLHSVLIAQSVTRWFNEKLGDKARYVRFGYNVFSMVSLVPVVWYYWVLESPVVVETGSWLTIVRIAGVAVSALFFYLGAREYDYWYFVGVRQMIAGADYGEQESVEFKEHGILGIVRHPYYTGGILFLVLCGDFRLSSLLVQIVFITYLVIGTFLEERKLLDQYGDAYRRYMERVPRFFPRMRKAKHS